MIERMLAALSGSLPSMLIVMGTVCLATAAMKIEAGRACSPTRLAMVAVRWDIWILLVLWWGGWIRR